MSGREQRGYGHCVRCRRDNVEGRIVSEQYGNSGGGWTGVECNRCAGYGVAVRSLAQARKSA